MLAGLSLMAISATATWAQDAAAPEAAPEAEAQAAPASPDPQAAYDAARNQLGVLSYCQDEGHIDGTAVEIQGRMLEMVPAGDVAQGDAAEANGKEGKVVGMGVETTLAEAATQQGATEAALCQQMDALIKQAGEQLPAE
ncbi:hypothetical protein CUV01_16015 [Paracoccus tegillarcae]|uniref:Uncharacterized protein n=2 Tax=Paracoccus tegillarcae TaxID=1529068 RepID=A0A2K9EMM0_9RHOB|nr:hypothetical protein CUV01_16015 [Paracoccus tegillarcae]